MAEPCKCFLHTRKRYEQEGFLQCPGRDAQGCAYNRSTSFTFYPKVQETPAWLSQAMMHSCLSCMAVIALLLVSLASQCMFHTSLCNCFLPLHQRLNKTIQDMECSCIHPRCARQSKESNMSTFHWNSCLSCQQFSSTQITLLSISDVIHEQFSSHWL